MITVKNHVFAIPDWGCFCKPVLSRHGKHHYAIEFPLIPESFKPSLYGLIEIQRFILSSLALLCDCSAIALTWKVTRWAALLRCWHHRPFCHGMPAVSKETTCKAAKMTFSRHDGFLLCLRPVFFGLAFTCIAGFMRTDGDGLSRVNLNVSFTLGKVRKEEKNSSPDPRRLAEGSADENPKWWPETTFIVLPLFTNMKKE